MWTRDPDVLVVGAGPVGLFAAHRIAELGMSVVVADKSRRAAEHSYALGLHPATLELLAETGLADPIIEGGYRVDRLAFYDGQDRRAELALAGLPFAHPYVLVLPQSRLEEVLLERLKQQGVKVLRSHRASSVRGAGERVEVKIDELDRVSAGYATATMEWVVKRTRAMKPRFVVGADGHRSFVRELLGIEFDEAGRSDLYAVFEFDADARPEREVKVLLHEGGADVLWPLPDGAFRWSFQLDEQAEPKFGASGSELLKQIDGQSFPQLGEGHLRTLIAERAPWFAAEPRNLRWSVKVRFERRLARRFGEGHIWLAGDAAHLAGPIGVHSMNVGLRESRDLAARIADVLKDGAEMGTLTTYELERQAEWRALLALDEAQQEGSALPGWLAAHEQKISECLPATGEQLDLLKGKIVLK